MSHRSERNFASFVSALVTVDEDDFAVMLDSDLAKKFIAARNLSREGHMNRQGTVTLSTTVNCIVFYNFWNCVDLGVVTISRLDVMHDVQCDQTYV